MSTVLELGRCKVSAEALNGGRGHAILLMILSWAAGETVTGFPRSIFVKYICEWTWPSGQECCSVIGQKYSSDKPTGPLVFLPSDIDYLQAKRCVFSPLNDLAVYTGGSAVILLAEKQNLEAE